MQGSGDTTEPAQGRGMMGILEGLVEGMVGAETINVVNGLIAQHGGVQGVMSQLQTTGFGP